MFSHVTVGCSDIEASARFYDAVLLPLGLVRRPVAPDGGPAAACWIKPGETLPRFYVYMPFDRCSASVGNGSMVGFRAADASAVDAFHGAGINAGGTGGRRTGSQSRTTETAITAPIFAIIDGNKVHAVYRGDVVV